MADCQCAERARNLSRLYDTRYLAAADEAQPDTQALAQQVRDDLATLADHCEQSSTTADSDPSPTDPPAAAGHPA